jgi:AcrR family transcriptional regulator
MSTPPGARRLRRDAQENLERVLEHAALVFAERGLDVTLADIAAAAGVGVGTLYRRFPDKDELILAVYQERMRGAIRKAEQASAAADPWQGFRGLIEAGAADFSDQGFRELVLGGLTGSLGWARSGSGAIVMPGRQPSARRRCRWTARHFAAAMPPGISRGGRG